MKLKLPSSLKEDIATHLRQAVEKAERSWRANRASEDSLTGALISNLEKPNWDTRIVDGSGVYRWRLDCTKIRGNGRGAPEKLIGADGIFQIEMHDEHTGEVKTKGLLFQAKKGKSRAGLQGQVLKMEGVCDGGCAIFIYDESGFDAIDGKAFLGNSRTPGDSLGDYLVDRFLECKVGQFGLHFDDKRETLFLPTEALHNPIPKGTDFEIATIEVERI